MTAIARQPAGSLARPAVILGGLAAIVGMRWLATIHGAADPLMIGSVFGIDLLVVGLLGTGWRPQRERGSSVVVGVAGGAVLVALVIVTRSAQISGLAPATAFGPWLAVTVLVATAEELVLRGALFDALDTSLGMLAAVLVTTAVFALVHVPLYGWHVVPLDLGVGLWLAGLRLATGGIAAPAIAHTIADLATRWL